MIHSSQAGEISFPAPSFLLSLAEAPDGYFQLLGSRGAPIREVWWSQDFPGSSGDLFTEVTGQVTGAAKVATVGGAAGDERNVDVEQCRSAVA